MPIIELGKIEKVDLRDVWPHEAHDFTKWLSEEENLALLGTACNLDLELVDTESAVGSFSVDILACETGTDRMVVIENQLEETNHDHLGKIITYAAGKDANTVIWVVARAREEHKRAVEWLNEHTDDEISFLLVEIEVWRIGGSQAAPRFNVLECPNEWARAERSKSNMSDTDKIKLNFWQTFREAALSNQEFSKTMRPQKPSAKHWMDISIGQKTCHVVALFSVQKSSVGVEICCNDKDLAQSFIDNIPYLENLIGAQGVPYDATHTSGIRFYRHCNNLKIDTISWPEWISWQLHALVLLRGEVLKVAATAE